MDLQRTRQVSRATHAFDNNFCLSDAPQPLRDVLWLTGQGGVRMTVATTCPGIQVYDGREAVRPGRKSYEGLAIEAQDWPDAPCHAGFPSIALNPGETYSRLTQWRFARPAAPSR
jgi:aldose 1-epimerase